MAGLRAAEELRRAGYDDRLTVVGDEPHLPYDRPPLSKELLAGKWEPEQIALTVLDDGGIDGLDVIIAAIKVLVVFGFLTHISSSSRW